MNVRNLWLSGLAAPLLGILAVSAASTSAGRAANAAELIQNGTPPIVGGACTLGPAWVGTGALTADTASLKAPDPCGFDFAGGPSTLTQSKLPTVSGQSYTLSFQIDDASPGGSGEIDISVDGVRIDHFIASGVLSGKGYVLDFYTTGGTSAFGEDADLTPNPGPSGSVLSFSVTGVGSWFLDDISLSGPVAAPAPIVGSTPAAMALVVLLFASEVLRRRRGMVEAGVRAEAA